MIRAFGVISGMLVVAAASAQGEPATTILDNGDPANRADIVIVGDGYRASYCQKLVTHVSGGAFG